MGALLVFAFIYYMQKQFNFFIIPPYPPLEKVEPNNIWERWSQTIFGKGGAKQYLGKVKPNI
jgi:hypothetical protein